MSRIICYGSDRKIILIMMFNTIEFALCQNLGKIHGNVNEIYKVGPGSFDGLK